MSGQMKMLIGSVGAMVLLATTQAQATTQRILRKEVVVRASIDDAWRMWTTMEGVSKFFSPDGRIELRVGGPYEMYFNGKPDATGRRGSEGSRVLSFVPREMLSFDWGFPPAVMKLRVAKEKTHVVLRFDELDGGEVRVRFAQLGWKDGPEWQAGYEYFDKAWSRVLDQFRTAIEKETPAPAKGDGMATGIVKHDRVYRNAADGATNESHVSCFAPFIGQWTSSIKESDGGDFNMRVVYEWGLGGKLVNVKSYVVKDKQPKLVYETTCGWQPRERQMTFRSFSLWDALYEGSVEEKNGLLEYKWDGFSADKVTKYRQTVRMTDKDHYEWTVFTKTDDGWEQSKQSTFVRQGTGAAAVSQAR